MKRPKIELSVAVEHAAWRRKWPSLAKDISRLIAAAAAHPVLKAKALGVVAVVLTDDKAQQRLNRRFRHKNRPTNVLSFLDESEPLGGISVAYETVLVEAKDQNKEFVNHSKHMILHGFLHLLGHDHVTKKEASLMEQVEIAILGGMGIPNPYLIETTSRA